MCSNVSDLSHKYKQKIYMHGNKQLMHVMNMVFESTVLVIVIIITKGYGHQNLMNTFSL